MEAKIIQKQKINYLVEHFKKMVVLVVVAILALGYFFLLNPKYKEIKAMKSEIGNKEAEEGLLQKKLIQMTKLRSAYKSINPDDLKKINIALPDSPTKDELLSQLDFLIAQNGLILSSLQIEDMQKEEKTEQKMADIGKIKINITVIGTDYYNFKNILAVLEKNLRLLDITSLKFSPKNEGVEMEMFTYYMK